MKTIGLLLDRLGDVVHAFAEPVGFAMLEEVQDTESPAVEHLDVLQHLRDFALSRPTLPGLELGTSSSRISNVEDAPEVFLQDVSDIQGLVDRKQILESNTLLWAQVFAMAQEQEARVLDVASAFRREFFVEAAPNLVDSQVQWLDDMKTVEDDLGAATFAQLEQIGIVHVDDGELQASCALGPKPLEPAFRGS